MKKWLALGLIFCFLVSMVACQSDIPDETAPYVHARIITVFEKSFLVESDTLGLCYLNFARSSTIKEYQKGDYIHVIYDGTVAETYPGQTNGLDVRKMTEDEIAAFYKETTVQGTYRGISNDMVLLYVKDRQYCFSADALNDSEALIVGDTVEVVYDGIEMISEYGIEICFPERVFVVTEEE